MKLLRSITKLFLLFIVLLKRTTDCQCIFYHYKIRLIIFLKRSKRKKISPMKLFRSVSFIRSILKFFFDIQLLFFFFSSVFLLQLAVGFILVLSSLSYATFFFSLLSKILKKRQKKMRNIETENSFPSLVLDGYDRLIKEK